MATIQDKVLAALAAREGQWLTAYDVARVISIATDEARQALRRLSAISKIERRELPPQRGIRRVEYRAPCTLEWQCWPGWAGLLPRPQTVPASTIHHMPD